TAVLEKGADDGYLCSSRWAGGIFHVSYHDVELDPPSLRAAIDGTTGGEAEPELAAAIAEDAARTVAWLGAQGASFAQVSPINWHRFTLAPSRAAVAGPDWQGRGPDQMIDRLRANLESRQGRMFLRTTAEALRMHDGQCTGLVARRDGIEINLTARTVVIADGGFPGDPELFRQYIGPSPDKILQRHAGSATGDGLRMAQAAGAASTRLDRFYGHLLSRDAMHDDRLWPYPQIDAVATAGIVVDASGRRLLDEGLGGIPITNDLARLDDPLCGTVICDTPIWKTAGCAAQIPPNPQLELAGGTLYRADTIEALAALAGIDADSLVDTIAAYNAAMRNGTGAALTPPRSAKSGPPQPIELPPFIAIPICAGITNTMGGIAIDGHGRVRREDGSIIAGLYAAGGCTGGLEGGGAVGYVGGLIKACVFGLRAAEDAARRIRSH
ncbi:MAG: FAD-binding protein, partial [Alphaproteobacteria bacterium]|nr:FAD-binding protein [Alphaproteobacteria bacterium]